MPFPTTILNLAHAAASNFLSAWYGGTVAHSTGDNLIIDDLAAAQTKLGTGASTATANTVLRGTAAGVTAFGQVVTADIAANAATKFASLSVASTSTASVSYVAMAGTSIAFTSTGTIYFLVSLLGVSNATAALMDVVFNIDGLNQISMFYLENTPAGESHSLTYMLSYPSSAGAHTYSLQWKTSAGTVGIVAGYVHIFESIR